MNFDLLRTLNGKKFPVRLAGRHHRHRARAGRSAQSFQGRRVGADVRRRARAGRGDARRAAQGELDILFPAFTAFHGFNVNVATLDLRTLQYLNPLFPKIKGTVSGTRDARLVVAGRAVQQRRPGAPRRRAARSRTSPAMAGSRGATSTSPTISRCRRSRCRSPRSRTRIRCCRCAAATRVRCR